MSGYAGFRMVDFGLIQFAFSLRTLGLNMVPLYDTASLIVKRKGR